MHEYRDASNRLYFDFFRIEADLYPKVTKSVVDQFKLESPKERLNIAWDVISWDYRRGEELVGLDWDHWSGYIVTAKSKSAEDLVREIAEFIDKKF